MELKPVKTETIVYLMETIFGTYVAWNVMLVRFFFMCYKRQVHILKYFTNFYVLIYNAVCSKSYIMFLFYINF